ncbi:hypothetical protein TPHA_0N01640 [Tetrapisispora phaffii CBS 4417]|uniref:Nuclear fusion protein KAR5 n=1 Tax=Tetrapisispora phaffii (strain ATCC 24235 / CBS 4417 / NBRC 1672 / NRRL Y-8282 / UCD 70-5) TaxID=1071381 RepID=G8C1B7_TETPH|nr:hypothetical protein TPHA_0N01640 [Tetrapisispora phaffii CBS 4417]CCE65945.1 hypothetical protein TPHA_0N01640 [Tetrapisispora phaffii CBS 4417]
MKTIKLYFNLILSIYFLTCNAQGTGTILNRISQQQNPANLDDINNRFPFLQSNCVKEALKELMPVCLKHGFEYVSSDLKVRTAVQMSLCEFRESGIENIPRECELSEGTETLNCLIELESYPQWWTTYSGNFQKLSSICFEYSLPYEKDQILQVFMNVTDLFGNINADLASDMEHLRKESKANSDIVKENFNDLFEDLEDTLDVIITELRNQNVADEIMNIREENLIIWDKLRNDTKSSLDNQKFYHEYMLQEMEDYFNEIKQKVSFQSELIASEAISSTLNIWKAEIDKEFANITITLNSTMHLLDDIGSKIGDFDKQVDSISNVFKTFNKLIFFVPQYISKLNINIIWTSMLFSGYAVSKVNILKQILLLPFKLPINSCILKLSIALVSTSILGTKLGSRIIE